MWIVRLALRRPYTFVVMAMLIVILGIVAVTRMPTDIFPEIDIPIVSVIWSYSGISPEEMAEMAKKMPGRQLPPGFPGAGAPGLPPSMPKLPPNMPGLPGLGGPGKFPGIQGLPGFGKKK